MNRNMFFDAVRAAPFLGSLNQEQIEGLDLIVGEAATRSMLLNQTAYVLATVFWETARTMQPIYERGSVSYFDRYEGRVDLENTQEGDGYRFRGRGYVQITGRRNYTLFAEILGIDLVGTPDLALRHEYAAAILFMGMERGTFTGKKLADYVTADRADFENARRVVHGTDRAQEIARIAEDFRDALEASGYVAAPPVPSRPVPDPHLASRPATPARLAARVAALFRRLFRQGA